MIGPVPIGALLFACAAALALRPFRRPRRLAVTSWLVGMVPSELPALLLVIVIGTNLPELVGGSGTIERWLALVIAGLTGCGLVVLTWRTTLARPALSDALLGLPRPHRESSRGTSVADRRRAHPLALVAPVAIRPRSVVRTDALRYGTEPWQLLDLYRPVTDPPARAPALVHLHGGRFRWGRRSKEGRALLHHLASRGWICLSADYRLAPSPGEAFPQCLIDVKRVIAWAHQAGGDHGIDPGRLHIVGSSAGAHLATMTALTEDDPRLQVGFEGVSTAVRSATGLYGYYGRLGGPADEWSSPSDHLRADRPPILLVHGTNDTYTPIEGARALTNGLRRSSPATALLAELPGAQHSFDAFPSVRFRAVIDAIDQFTAAIEAQPRRSTS